MKLTTDPLAYKYRWQEAEVVPVWVIGIPNLCSRGRAFKALREALDAVMPDVQREFDKRMMRSSDAAPV